MGFVKHGEGPVLEDPAAAEATGERPTEPQPASTERASDRHEVSADDDRTGVRR